MLLTSFHKVEDLHEGLVVGADLLHVEVELCVDVGLDGAVRAAHPDQTRHVLVKRSVCCYEQRRYD